MLFNKLAGYAGILLCICTLQSNIASAQAGMPAADTLRLTLQAAEKTFLDSNLQLLAQHYNIHSSEALVEQARKWENPVLNTDQNLYANNKFLQHSSTDGEVFVQVQQLIKTAGKRGRQIDLAKTNVNQAEWQFKATMRSLHATLVTDFYTIAQLQGNAALYNDNMARLMKLRTAMEAALNAGNVARKEYLRVQALIVSLQQDMTDNAKSLADAESELKTLLELKGNVFILPAITEEESADVSGLSLPSLIDTARYNNTDYMQEVYQLQYQRQNLKLQRAIGVPDLTVGTEFDQSANYAPNYYGLALSIPIPILDRNRGNIKSAKWQVAGEEAMMKEADNKLQNDVQNAFEKLLMTAQLSASSNKTFYADYTQLYKNIVESFNNRQISMIEFLDYFNDYQDVRKQQLQQILNLRLAKLNLNDVVGKDIVR